MAGDLIAITAGSSRSSKSQEAACLQAQAARRPRAQGRRHHLRATRRRPNLGRRSRCLQEPFLHHENEPHRGPAEFGQQPRLRYVHEDALYPRTHRRPRRGLRHRDSHLEHHGRDVHDAPLEFVDQHRNYDAYEDAIDQTDGETGQEGDYDKASGSDCEKIALWDDQQDPSHEADNRSGHQAHAKPA
jgi:hypothetical protein